MRAQRANVAQERGFNIARKARWMGYAHHDGLDFQPQQTGFYLSLILCALEPS